MWRLLRHVRQVALLGCAAAALGVLLGLTVPAAACATTTLGVGEVDYAAGNVTILATLDAPAATIVFVDADGTPFDVETVAAGQTTVESAPVHLTAAGTFAALGEDATGLVVWVRTLALNPAAYVPTVNGTFRPLPNGVVKSTTKVTGTSSHPVTKVAIAVGGKSQITTQTARTLVSMTGLRVPRGAARLSIRLGNGFGLSSLSTRTVWQLGADDLVGRSRYCVIDKATFWQYFVSGGRMVKRWPVAIGMPSTPTPRGTFYIGKPMAAGGAWGVLRRRLYRKTSSGSVATCFYVHGTNDPSSIGTMASHGCVRMYNSGIRDHAKRVPNGTVIRIR